MPKHLHGMYGTRVYRIYRGMKDRCNNPNAPAYKYYGGRGIKVCKEWNESHGFVKFYEWAVVNGYADDLTIDRIDVNGDYSPSNCRWVSNLVQARNKRNNVKYTFNGCRMCLSEISEIVGVGYSTLKERIRTGGELDTSPTRFIYVNYNGRSVSLHELADLTGIKYTTLLNRKKQGYSDEEMVVGHRAKSKSAVVQIDSGGNVVSFYESIKDASKATNIAASSISDTAAGRRKRAGGYFWKYEKDMQP